MTHPLVTAILSAGQRIMAGRAAGVLQRWPSGEEMLQIAEQDLDDNLTMRPRQCACFLPEHSCQECRRAARECRQ